MPCSLGRMLGVVFALTLIAVASQTAQAQNLEGTWELNYPALAAPPVVWEFAEEGSSFAGTASQETQFTTLESEIVGSSILGRIYIGQSTTVLSPVGIETFGIVLFVVDGDELNGIFIEFLGAIPFAFGELNGNRLLLEE